MDVSLTVCACDGDDMAAVNGWAYGTAIALGLYLRVCGFDARFIAISDIEFGDVEVRVQRRLGRTENVERFVDVHHGHAGGVVEGISVNHDGRRDADGQRGCVDIGATVEPQ